jgi:amidase
MRIVTILFALALSSEGALAMDYDVSEKSIATLQADLSSGKVTSEALVRAYLERIEQIDRSGPALHSVISINPDALADARARDAARRTKGPRGALDGIPLLVKDNIETADPIPTTAGSLALADNVTHRDAPIIARLRAAGAIILGKTNLSEWANFRSSHSISGWSAIGGLTKNPYSLDRSPCGSSAGSGAAAAASLAAATIGTETDGSLVCPGSFNGVVSLKPTVGLLSRTHIVPISHSQDTPGPMTRSVNDAALLLSVMAGSDVDDPATKEADTHKADYSAALATASLVGKRVAVVMPDLKLGPSETEALFMQTIERLKQAGAIIVELKPFSPPPDMRANEFLVMCYELKHDLNDYLAGLPTPAKVRTLADLIAFNNETPRETTLFGQEFFEKSQALGGLDSPAYIAARDTLRADSQKTLDGVLANADALIAITADPASRIDIVRREGSGHSASYYPATSGYPHLTVPMGYVRGLPVGLSFIGPAWSEAKLLALGHAFEKIAPPRQPPTFAASLEAEPDAIKAFAPAKQ